TRLVSDWSSDVCSSDLFQRVPGARRAPRGLLDERDRAGGEHTAAREQDLFDAQALAVLDVVERQGELADHVLEHRRDRAADLGLTPLRLALDRLGLGVLHAQTPRGRLRHVRAADADLA